MKIKVKLTGIYWPTERKDKQAIVDIKQITLEDNSLWYCDGPGYEMEAIEDQQKPIEITSKFTNTIRDLLGQDIKMIEFK